MLYKSVANHRKLGGDGKFVLVLVGESSLPLTPAPYLFLHLDIPSILFEIEMHNLVINGYGFLIPFDLLFRVVIESNPLSLLPSLLFVDA